MTSSIPLATMKYFAVAWLLAALGCQSSTPKQDDRQVVTNQPARTIVGEPVPVGNPLSVTTVLRNADRLKGTPILVEGFVRKACTKKGCWLELAESSSPSDASCRVTFKDYGFFVPTDSQGTSARIYAEVRRKEIDANQVIHLEQEGANFSQKQKDGSALEIQLIASGVELTASNTTSNTTNAPNTKK